MNCRNKLLIMLFATIFLYTSQAAMAQDPMGSLKVVVKDFYDDTPITGAEVLMTPCDDFGTTDNNGECTLSPVVPFRNYQVDVEADGYIKRSSGFVTVQPDQETVLNIPLKQESTISGQVTDGSLPLENVTVMLGYYEETPTVYFVSVKSVKTDSTGMYTLENVDEGPYKIVALADNYVRNMVDIDAVAGQTHTQNFILASAGSSSATVSIVLRQSFSGDPLPLPTYLGKRAYFDGKGSTGAEEFFWLKESVPPGSVPMGQEYYLGASQVYSFIIPASGDYEVRLFITDASGIVTSDSITFSAANIAPEAVPSVIPGPTELPYVDSSQVYSATAGSTFVAAGSIVYLRGFAVDQTLISPEEFNPDAPCFDIYGNKNGNFKASTFGYSWTLKDKNGTDITSLLTPSPTSENVSFTVPAGTPVGDYFVATLTVTDDEDAESDPEDVTITVSNVLTAEATCAMSGCHNGADDPPEGYKNTRHSDVGTKCQDCHGPASEHIADPHNKKLSISYWPGVCGQCHMEFAEIQKTNHSDPLPFGYYEPSEGRLTSCYKCHYTPGYVGAVESGIPFPDFHYGPDDLAGIPKDTPNVSCSVCHDPHPENGDAPYGLRTGSTETACDTCHHEKWQNAILEGLAGEFENGYHYPGEDYSSYLGENNPHRTEDKCVLCHMDTSMDVVDENGVRKIGGHTLRMRDFGDDQIPETGDDILNIAVCQTCHEDLTDFDRNGVQTEVKELLTTLGNLLKGANHDFLPANQPGKCARCHKGGTVPFVDDPICILENAYTNYKLILNDRSWGVHNPGYVKKLLEDSIMACEGEAFVCNADINLDGKVNLTDLVIMKTEFNSDCNVNPCESDCNGDNKVNLSDLVILKGEFNRNDCPSCS